jgi:predicted dinucleotide-utilizing enzyme
MAWYLVFWRNRSTSTVVPAASASQVRSCAQRSHKRGCEAIVVARGAKVQDSQLIRSSAWPRK